jgi:disulfide bond formation protein DsbB
MHDSPRHNQSVAFTVTKSARQRATPSTGLRGDLKYPVILAILFAGVPLSIIALVIIATPMPKPTQWHIAAARIDADPAEVAIGAYVYARSCVSCHGADGQGVPRLGKPLRNSAFVQTASDETLFGIVAKGRPAQHPENTTGIPMPPGGGRVLGEYHTNAVVQYIKTMQEPGQPLADLSAWEKSAHAVVSKPRDESAFDVDAVTNANTRQPPTMGMELFAASCASCHGVEGEGIDGLGLPLEGSEFVVNISDKDLRNFIKTGRPIWDADNKTGLDMPAKGGNPAITDTDLDAIIEYIRFLNDKGIGSDESAFEAPSAEPEPLGEQAMLGRELFAASCASCHGVDGEGIDGLGLPLDGSEFVVGLSDKDLRNFIKTGRPVWDAGNKSGLDMPAKGGNPAITDTELDAIIAYIRALNAEQ